jgi:predicted DCC family thiol-disulfide oxidoreductase YuxK
VIIQKLILFDGVCNFCNYWVNFIIDRDNHDVFHFAALQSEIGQKLLKKYKINTSNFDTFVLVDGEEYFSKSTAAFKVSKDLRGIWKYLYFLIFIPKPIRDFVYRIIAKNRYKIFGRRDVSRIPTEKEKVKFLN